MSYVLAMVGVVAILVVVVVVVRRLHDVHVCARVGLVGRLRTLLDANPTLVSSVDGAGETPVHKAAKYGEVEALRLLIERGGDVDAGTRSGVTPLHLAAGFGELAAVKFLLERRAAPDPKEETGLTPIMVAQAGGHAEVVEALKAAGANADAIPPIADFGGGHFVYPIADDDPLMRIAQKQARESLDSLRRLSAVAGNETLVKFAFRTDQGATEHLWGEVLELRTDAVKVRVCTPPLEHEGTFTPVQERSIGEIEDWKVVEGGGRIRGGFGYQVLFHRTKEKLGRLPAELAEAEPHFVDHDIAALLREAGEAK